MRRLDTRAHPCFNFIVGSLGRQDLLFESAKVPHLPELVKSNVKKNTRNEMGFRGLAILRETMS